jgi:signal transduction histidine kinase
LVHNFSSLQLFQHFISLPSSIELILFGLALTMSRAHYSYLLKPFYSLSPWILLYTGIVCLSWLLFVMWQAFGWVTQLTSPEMSIAMARGPFLFIEIFEAVFCAFVLGIGLNILGVLDENARLYHKLQESFQNYALLAATLSHDLKAPIQTQINAIEMIESGKYYGPIPEKAGTLLRSINENNRFELQLVLNLIDLLRFELRKETFNPEQIDIPALFEEMKQELLPQVITKGQSLSFACQFPELAILQADSTGLRRVLNNLIHNAIRHQGTGHSIQVTAEKQDDSFLFSVKDDGPGIAPEIRETLFQEFTQGINQTTNTTGSGLGLFIAHQIVVRHGGKIWVESEPGKGSRFCFILPASAVIENPPSFLEEQQFRGRFAPLTSPIKV